MKGKTREHRREGHGGRENRGERENEEGKKMVEIGAHPSSRYHTQNCESRKKAVCHALHATAFTELFWGKHWRKTALEKGAVTGLGGF